MTVFLVLLLLWTTSRAVQFHYLRETTKKTDEFLLALPHCDYPDTESLIVRAAAQMPTVANALVFATVFFMLSIFSSIMLLGMMLLPPNLTPVWSPIVASCAVAGVTVGSFNINVMHEKMVEIISSYGDVFED